jgi:hypothetical protein
MSDTFVPLDLLSKSRFMKKQNLILGWEMRLDGSDVYETQIVKAVTRVAGHLKTVRAWYREYNSPYRKCGLSNPINPDDPNYIVDLGEIFDDDYVAAYDAAFLAGCGVTIFAQETQADAQ